MLESLPTAQADVILAIMAAYREDPRPHRIDLGVGVYRDPQGETPVFRAIREAERRVQVETRSKIYTSPLGDPAFNDLLGAETFGPGLMSRAVSATGIGGSGALQLLARLVREAAPGARVHIPAPTWPNHRHLLGMEGLEIVEYPYLDAAGRALDFDAMAAALEKLGPGDAVILHACCHNPTGEDPTPEQWAEIAAIAARRGWLPMFDMAYAGFGDGWEEDCAGMRAVIEAAPEALASVSCSKNFGLYRDRAGAAYVFSHDAAARDRARGSLATLIRGLYSMPPFHGGELVRQVLSDPFLKADWAAELEGMRLRIQANRKALADALAAKGGQGLSFIGAQRGLFSLLGLTPAQVTELRETHALYVVPGGRINLAGLREGEAEAAAEALLAVA